jgi:hypothetical protein
MHTSLQKARCHDAPLGEKGTCRLGEYIDRRLVDIISNEFVTSSPLYNKANKAKEDTGAA